MVCLFIFSFAVMQTKAFVGQAQEPCDLEWSYRDVDAWPEIGMCDHTDDQSPINIATSEVVEGELLRPLDLMQGPQETEGDLELDTHTWQLNFPNVSAGITWDGVFYTLSQLHFHSPSENTVDGKHYDMEMHCVHASEDGKGLVVAYLFDARLNRENEYLANFWHKFPKQEGEKPSSVLSTPYKSHDALYSQQTATTGAYYTFDGSLTTPPCTNHVRWLVMKDPAPMTLEQLDSYRHGIMDAKCNQLRFDSPEPHGVALPWNTTLGTNHRSVQLIGDRKVLEFIPANKQQGESLLVYGLLVVVIGAALSLAGAAVLKCRRPKATVVQDDTAFLAP